MSGLALSHRGTVTGLLCQQGSRLSWGRPTGQHRVTASMMTCASERLAHPLGRDQTEKQEANALLCILSKSPMTVASSPRSESTHTAHPYLNSSLSIIVFGHCLRGSWNCPRVETKEAIVAMKSSVLRYSTVFGKTPQPCQILCARFLSSLPHWIQFQP